MNAGLNSGSALDARDALKAANWLALAAVVLPFLQLFPLDFDRTSPLLLLPALWFGRLRLALALARFVRGPLWLRTAGAIALLATVVSISLSDQPAPATVAAAAWWVLIAASLTAGQLLEESPALGERLWQGLAVGAAAATLATWFLWWNTGKGAMPVYANPRHLGMHMLGGVMAATTLAVRPALSPRRRWGWWLTGSIAWGGLFWSGGRTAVLGMGVALVMWWWRTPSAQRRRLVGSSVGTALAGLLISAIFWSPRPEYGWWTMISRTSAGIDQGTVSAVTTTRTDFWRETVQRARSAPWFGHGPDSYRFLTPKLDGQQPHNVVLQLWLDLGVVGALPALAVLAAALTNGLRTEVSRYAPWFALLAGSVAAGMMDGFFYHVLAWWPAMFAIGVLLGTTPQPAPASPGWCGRIAGFSVALAAGILGLHAWLFQQVAVAPPPATPQAFTARLLRNFPSTSYGLWRWLDAWQETDPAASLSWARWASLHSAFAPTFQVYAARCLLQQNDRVGAAIELQSAWRSAHAAGKPGIEALQRQYGLPLNPGDASH